MFDNLGYEKTFLNNSDDADINVWNIKTNDYNITYIQTGIGAPVLSDVRKSIFPKIILKTLK